LIKQPSPFHQLPPGTEPKCSFLQKRKKRTLVNVLVLNSKHSLPQLPQGAVPKGLFLQKRNNRTLVNVLILNLKQKNKEIYLPSRLKPSKPIPKEEDQKPEGASKKKVLSFFFKKIRNKKKIPTNPVNLVI
jgi:hypothetical protein